MNIKRLEVRDIVYEEKTINMRLYDTFGGFLDFVFGWEKLEGLYENIRNFLDEVNRKIIDKLIIEGANKEKINDFGKNILNKIENQEDSHILPLDIDISIDQ